MAPRVKSSAPASASASVSAPAPAPVVEQAPVASADAGKPKAPRKPKASSDAKKEAVVETKKETAPVAAPADASAEASAEETANISVADKVKALQTDLHAKIDLAVTKLVEAYTQKVERLYAHESKELHKQLAKQIALNGKGRRNKRVAGGSGEDKPRKPSGFQLPTDISDELAEFMGVAKGTQLPRASVTTYFSKYVRDKKLSDPEDGRRIIPDATLKKLLRVADGEVVTYFALQKHLKHHFPKAAAKA